MKRILTLTLLALAATAYAAPPLLKATPNTKCGEAGVGKVWGTKGGWKLEARPALPNQRVNAKGVWMLCDLPPDCATQPATDTWTNGAGIVCKPQPGQVITGRDLGRISVVRGQGDPRNKQSYRCEIGTDDRPTWVPHRTNCR